MKFSEKWLRKVINPQVSTTELVDALTMAGLELESLEKLGDDFNGVVIGAVLEAEKHPNADKLKVCKVEIEKDAEPLQIVCGASNVRAGLKVPVAVVGAIFANGLVIKRAKLRGVESQGMICSEKELGLADNSLGIMELPDDAPIGMDFKEYLDLEDNIIELNVTPNRGDVLSIYGVARDVAAIYDLAFPKLKVNPIKEQLKDTFKVEVKAKEACPHYLGRVILGVNCQAKTPNWMQRCLEGSGIRPISLLVDITNYVMLELGQPLHAFDLDRLHGSISVRFAKEGEKLTLLDETELTLDEEVLVIADQQKPLALAGVMGGIDSGISNETQNLFIESAYFKSTVVAKSAKKYAVNSDSSYRFERGVDPDLQKLAIERVTELVLELADGEAGPIIELKQEQYLPGRNTLIVNEKNIERLLGIKIAPDKVHQILRSLNIECEKTDGGWKVKAPSYRFDLELEEDYIEEVARIYGYNNIEECEPELVMPAAEHIASSNLRARKLRIIELLAAYGYSEIVSLSFIDQKLQKLVEPDLAPVELANPLSFDAAHMRVSLWPQLLQTFLYNQKRKADNLKLFTSGVCFVKDGDKVIETSCLAGLVSVDNYKKNWSAKEQNKQQAFFVLKGELENVFDLLHLTKRVRFLKEVHPALHPGMTARIYVGNKAVGWLGVLHPGLGQKLDISDPVILFSLDLKLLNCKENLRFKAISKFPLVRRDIAVIVDNKWSWSEIYAQICSVDKAFLQDVELFDIYSGEGIELGKRSLAMHLILQRLDQTLTDNEIDRIVSEVIASLGKNFDAKLRG